MKKLQFIIFTLILVGCSASRQLSVQTNSSDVLYVGIDNPIVFKGNNLNKIAVSVENGKIKELVELSNDTLKSCIIQVDNNNPTFIKIEQGKKNTIIKYRNKNIPTPEIFITTDSTIIICCSISQEKFRTARGLGCHIQNFDYNISMKILSYKLTIIKKGKALISNTIKGNVVKDYAQFADSSDIFIFHDVLIEFIENKEQRVLSGPTIFIN